MEVDEGQNTSFFCYGIKCVDLLVAVDLELSIILLLEIGWVGE